MSGIQEDLEECQGQGVLKIKFYLGTEGLKQRKIHV